MGRRLKGLRIFDMKKAAAIGLCCALVMAGCRLPVQEESASQPVSSASQPSSSQSVPPPSSSSSKSSSSSAPSSSSMSPSSSEEPQRPESDVSQPASSSSASSDPGGGTDVPVQPESQEPSLWQLADVTIEKWVYGAETSRIYFRLTNNSGEAMYIMRDYELEKLEGGKWVPLGTHRLASQTIRHAVEPGQKRLVGVPLDWLKEPSERYGDDRIPEGYYRLRVYINQHFWRTVPFEIQADPLEEDTTFYEIHTIKSAYLTASPNVDYEVVNKTDQELSFSYRCFLERWDGEVWRRCESSGGPDFTIIVAPRSVMRESFPLEIFHPLEPGHYRLVKTLARNNYYAPFTLVENLEELENPDSPKEDEKAKSKDGTGSSSEGEETQENIPQGEPQAGEGESESESVSKAPEGENTESEPSQPQETPDSNAS